MSNGVDNRFAYHRQRVGGRLFPLHPDNTHFPLHVGDDEGFGQADLLGQRAANILAHKFVAHGRAGVADTDNLGIAEKALWLLSKEQNTGYGGRPVGAKLFAETAPRRQNYHRVISRGHSDPVQVALNLLLIQLIERGFRRRLALIAAIATFQQQAPQLPRRQGSILARRAGDITPTQIVEMGQPRRHLHHHHFTSATGSTVGRRQDQRRVGQETSLDHGFAQGV